MAAEEDSDCEKAGTVNADVLRWILLQNVDIMEVNLMSKGKAC